jgi:hypothetical protein
VEERVRIPYALPHWELGRSSLDPGFISDKIQFEGRQSNFHGGKACMTATVRRLTRELVLGRSLIATAARGGNPAAVQSCDAASISHCVPPVWEVGDLDRDYFDAQTISHI